MDFATLKTYFSHVKKGGNVYFVADYSEYAKSDCNIMPRDFIYVHPHIFLEMGKVGDKMKGIIPLLYYPRFTLGYFFGKLNKNMGIYKNSTWKMSKIKNYNIDKVKKFVDRIDTVINFCWKRKINPRIILINSDSKNNSVNNIIKADLALKYPEFELNIVSNAKELNNIIGGKNAI